MTGAFLDTVGLIATWDRRDQWHAPAEAAFKELLSARVDLYTTTFVLIECANAAARCPYRGDVCQLRTELEAAEMLVTPTEHDWLSAWRAYERGEAGSAGIVDHVSFVAMRRLGLTHAFTDDEHFEAAGFVTLF